MNMKRPKTFQLVFDPTLHFIVITIILAVFWIFDTRAVIQDQVRGKQKKLTLISPLFFNRFVCFNFDVMKKTFQTYIWY